MTTQIDVAVSSHQLEVTKRGRSDEILDVETMEDSGKVKRFYIGAGESLLIRELPVPAGHDLPYTSGKATRISQQDIDAASGKYG